jgi:hypothetical protein
VLFNYLAWCHVDMFGCPPEAEQHRGERDGRSIEWAREFLLLATEKVPPVLVLAYGMPAATEEVKDAECDAIKAVSQLSDATLADWLAEGARFVRRHQAPA